MIQIETSSITVVEEFLHSLETLDMARAEELLDDNVVYQNVPMPADRGKTAAIATLKNFMRIATGFEVRIHSIAERDGVVLTERTDILSGPGVHLEFWVCGTFTVKNGKITEWKDYFDILTVMGQIAKSSPGIAAAFVKSLFNR